MGPLVRIAVTGAALLALSIAATPLSAQVTAQWTARSLSQSAAGTPGGRGWVDLIHDPVLGRPVLFGGSGGNYMNDVLNIDFVGSRWVNVESNVANVQTPYGPPCPRDEHAVEFDADNRLYWSFGGSGYTCGFRAGTMGSGSTTTRIVDPSLTSTVVNFYRDWLVGVPGANTYFSFVSAYDPATKTLTLVTPIPTVLAGRAYELFLAGGGTWSYNPASRAWRGLEAPGMGYGGASPRNRLSPAFAYTPRDGAVVMFGGMTYNDTWALDTQTQAWVQMKSDGAAGSPPRRAQVTNSMAYDSVRDAFVLFGGVCGDGNGCGGVPYQGLLGDTWVYRLGPNTWTRMTPPSAPSPRAQHTLTFDPGRAVFVLVGGSTATGASSDVWVYDLGANTWTKATSSGSVDARYLHGAVYDPSLGEHVVYGGSGATGATLWSTATIKLIGSGNAAPTASMVVSPGSGPATTTFSFDGTTSRDTDGTITAYAWNFGDGATATGATTTHRYASAGTYSVRLTVTDNAGATGSTTQTVVVSAAGVAPVARITVTPQSPAASFVFDGRSSTDSDGTIVNYAWDFGDGTSATGAVANKVYSVGGNFTVRLTVTDNSGLTSTAQAAVTAAPGSPVTVLFTRTVAGSITNGGSVTAVTANGVPVSFTTGANGAFQFTLSGTAPTTFAVVITASVAGAAPVTQSISVAVP